MSKPGRPPLSIVLGAAGFVAGVALVAAAVATDPRRLLLYTPRSTAVSEAEYWWGVALYCLLPVALAVWSWTLAVRRPLFHVLTGFIVGFMAACLVVAAAAVALEVL